MIRFNIVIPTHARPELLKRTLTSLAEASKPEGFENVIVIENGSNDGADLICKQFLDELPLIYKHQSQPGKGRAVQSVLNELESGFVLFLDDDVRVCSDLLTQYASAIKKYGSGYVYGGPILVDYEAEPEEWLKNYLPLSASVSSITEQSIQFLKMGYFLGANFGAFVEGMLEVGGFQMDIGPGSHVAGTEGNPTGLEREIQHRMRDDGKQQHYLKNAKVWHFVPRNRCSPSWTLRRIYRNHITDAQLQVMNNDNPIRCYYGVPVIIWVYYPLYGLLMLMSYFMPIARYRFKMKRRYFGLRGMIKGHQLARR